MNVVVIEPGSIATPIWQKGSDAVDETAPKLSPEAERLYGPQMDRMRVVTKETAERGMDPLKVAEVIEKAIRSTNPKARYLVGRDAKIMKRMQSLAGDKRFDRIMRRTMKLPDHAPKAR
jgi:NAD(P)-dependent dehydrogenase (short-subunit alcohol dehydrogenase family)